MTHRSNVRPARRTRRRTFAAQVFGLSMDTDIATLKQYLHAADLTPSPETKLDLVMVDDYDHFAELVAEHGVPLARSDAELPDARVPLWRRLTVLARRKRSD